LIFKKINSTYLTFLTTLIVFLNPVFFQSLFGQPYYDRLYVLFSFLIAFYSYKLTRENNKRNVFLFFLILFFSTLIVEKALIYNAIFLVAFSLLYFKKLNKIFIISNLVISVSSLFIYSILTSKYLDNHYYKTLKFDYILENYNEILFSFLSNTNLLYGSIYLFIILFPLLLIQVLAKSKFLIISIILLIPNIIFTIGGAEKFGFYTHYHSMYFGFIIFGFIHSWVNFFEVSCIKNNKTNSLFFVTTYFLFSFVIYSSIVFDDKIKFSLEKFSLIKDYKNLVNSDVNNELKDFIHYNISYNSNIVASEFSLPYLVGFNNVSFYPYNIQTADYIIVDYENHGSQKLPYLMTFSQDYYPNDIRNQNLEIRSILLKRLNSYGFNLDKPLFDDGKVIILDKYDK